MPTIIAVDSSLSMLQPLPKAGQNNPDAMEDDATDTVFDLAKMGINMILEHLKTNYKLEQVAMLSFASQCELVSPFTRDVASIQDQMASIDCYDKTNVMAGIRGIASAVEDHWGTGIPVNVVLVTDGGLGNGPESLGHFVLRGCVKRFQQFRVTHQNI